MPFFCYEGELGESVASAQSSEGQAVASLPSSLLPPTVTQSLFSSLFFLSRTSPLRLSAMFKRRPSIFNKDSKASPSTSSLPTPLSDGGAVKRRTSFFSSQKSSTTSFSTNTTTLPSGVSTPGSTGGLERSNSLPGIAPPELRKRADSSDGSGSASERSSLEDLRRQVHEEGEGDHEEGEGREGLIGRENGRRRDEEEEEEGHDEEKHDSVAALPPPSSASASAASRSPLPPSASSLPPPPPIINGNGNGHLPVPTNGSSSLLPATSPSSPLPPAIDIPSSPSAPAPSPSSPSHPSHPHHHHHHHHSHSPPLAAPPPLRATTISALTPPPSSAASSITQPKKRSFMSMGNGKAKKEVSNSSLLPRFHSFSFFALLAVFGAPAFTNH